MTAWADAIRNADGIIIASPEYNWTIPGAFKNALDWVSRMKDQPFKGKPAGKEGAGKPFGGKPFGGKPKSDGGKGGRFGKGNDRAR